MHAFFATCSKGSESLLVDEFKEIGVPQVREEKGGVAFQSTVEGAYRICLWSRIAQRVLLPLKTFPSYDADRLYAGTRSIDWSEHMTAEQTLAVDFALSGKPASGINHSHFGAMKVKDAICDQFRDRDGIRPSVQPDRPNLQINVRLHDGQATISIDLSGESLHRRGYREDGAKAPLKETLAAAILRHAGWHRIAREGGIFMDPMCGSGTLEIEAAMVATDRAPGLTRDYFGFLGWQDHKPAMWERLLEEARVRFKEGQNLPASKKGAIIGYDEDFRAVNTALSNLEKIGLRGRVHFEKRELDSFEPPANLKPIEALEAMKAPRGIVVVNPPYGERLGEVNELKPLYRRMGDRFKKSFAGWEAYVFTGSPELSKEVGLSASRRFVLMNGPIECRLLKYELFAGRKATPGAAEPVSE